MTLELLEDCHQPEQYRFVGIGAGADVAVETGDVVLMKSDPADVLAAIRISKATVRKMKQNLFWAVAGALYPSLESEQN